MSRKRHRARVSVTAIGFSLLLVVIGGQRPVFSQERTKAEEYVLGQAAAGDPSVPADFEKKFPGEHELRLSGAFIKELLTNPDNRLDINPHGITISHAVITGEVDLINDEIKNDVTFAACTFEGPISAGQSHFVKTLDLSGSTFKGNVDFENAVIGFDLLADRCSFDSKDPDSAAFFKSVRIGGDWSMVETQFAIRADFTQADVGGNAGGNLEAERSMFQAGADFNGIKVKGNGNLREVTVGGGAVSLLEARFTNFFLNDAHFEKASELDFTRLQVESVFFDHVAFNEQGPVRIEGITFKFVSPATWDALKVLTNRAEYNPEFYTNLETLFRSHGYAGQADKVFIEKQRHDRREICKDFFRNCERRSWAWSLFQDLLAGYGRSLENLLYWSIGFVFIGWVVFGREAGMKTKKAEDKAQYAGKYKGLWYSLDLFLPVIDLGDAELWTPRDDRRWALLYKRVHAIVGHLFIPIGLAALTGIIK